MNPFDAIDSLKTKSSKYKIYRLDSLTKYGQIDKLPFSIRVLLESVLRNVDGRTVTEDDVTRLEEHLLLFDVFSRPPTPDSEGPGIKMFQSHITLEA